MILKLASVELTYLIFRPTKLIFRILRNTSEPLFIFKKSVRRQMLRQSWYIGTKVVLENFVLSFQENQLPLNFRVLLSSYFFYLEEISVN